MDEEEEAFARLDDCSELAEDIFEAFEKGHLLDVLKGAPTPVQAFDYAAELIEEDWLYSEQSTEGRSALADLLEDCILWLEQFQPNSAVLWYWRLIHSWMTSQYETYLRLYGERDIVPPALLHRWYPDTVEGYRIRSLIRLKRFEEAAQVALERGNHADWYLMTVYAVKGESDNAIPILEKCLEQFSVHDEWIQGNSDLWEALQRPEYSDWLQKAVARESHRNATPRRQVT